MMNNIYMYVLRTRTRNARTRANANVIQTCGLLQLAVAGQTIRASSKTILPSVFLLRANLRIPQKRTSAKVASLCCLAGKAKSMPNHSQKMTFAKL